MAFLIGHDAYRQFESLPTDVDVRDFKAVHKWAYENEKGALYDWMSWRWDRQYLRALDEGFEPATLYFGIAVPERRGSGEWEETVFKLQDENGVWCWVLFSRFRDARHYCTEWAALDEFPGKERQDETGELISPSIARIWEPKALPLYMLKPRHASEPVILDPTVEGPPGTRLTVAELEDND